MRLAIVLVPALSLFGACHDGSSSQAAPTPGPGASTSNLGLAIGRQHGSGDLRLVVVPEAEQGQDLDGDGDVLDGGFVGAIAFGVVHVVDLEHESVVNTGLVLAVTRPHSIEVLPEPVLAVGSSSLAFGVDELATGGLDRNGDGDAQDFVLAVYDRDGARTVNLGLAVSRVALAHPIVAFDVPEDAQGEDLDGDGTIGSTSVPFVHDLRTDETWSTGLRGRHVLGVMGAGASRVAAHFVALAASESVLGDQNGDGDASDLVFEVYDVAQGRVQSVGLALLRGNGALASPPFVHDGRWTFSLSEWDQAADLDGDGDALDLVSVVYDPVAALEHTVGPLFVVERTGVARLVLFEQHPPGFPIVWLYDADTDVLASTSLRSVDVAQVGTRTAIGVVEEAQGEDLDRNGALESLVPVLVDFRSGREENLGIDSIALQGLGDRLLLRSRESASQADWNGDGDREDTVLFVWHERTRRLVNSRLAVTSATWSGTEVVLLTLSEEDLSTDLNADGDALDGILHAYDVGTGGLTNLGLATGLPLQPGGERGLISVQESSQGQDLNGDGDRLDRVLHLVQTEL